MKSVGIIPVKSVGIINAKLVGIIFICFIFQHHVPDCGCD